MKKPVRQKYAWSGERKGKGLGGIRPGHSEVVELGWSRMALFFSCLLALLLFGWVVWQVLGQWSFFQLTAIRIEGGERIGKEWVLALSGVDVHSNLLMFSTTRVRNRLIAHDWVESARVSREWPNRLRITVRERRPVAILALPDGMHYIDAGRNIFALVLPPDNMDFPVISGLPDVDAWQPEHNKRLGEALSLLRLAGRGGVVLPAQGISEINVDHDGRMVLFPLNPSFPVYFGENVRVGVDYNRLVRVLGRLQRDRIYDEIVSVHLDYLPGQVLVRRRI